MSNEDLRALAEKATPGPWHWEQTYDWGDRTEGNLRCAGRGLYDDPDGLLVEPTGHETEAIRLRVTDAAYICAASPDRVVALLDELDFLKSDYEQARAALRAENERLLHAIKILQDNWPKTIPAPMDRPKRVDWSNVVIDEGDEAP